MVSTSGSSGMSDGGCRVQGRGLRVVGAGFRENNYELRILHYNCLGAGYEECIMQMAK
jgi:hypothetical protein